MRAWIIVGSLLCRLLILLQCPKPSRFSRLYLASRLALLILQPLLFGPKSFFSMCECSLLLARISARRKISKTFIQSIVEQLLQSLRLLGSEPMLQA